MGIKIRRKCCEVRHKRCLTQEMSILYKIHVVVSPALLNEYFLLMRYKWASLLCLLHRILYHQVPTCEQNPLSLLQQKGIHWLPGVTDSSLEFRNMRVGGSCLGQSTSTFIVGLDHPPFVTPHLGLREFTLTFLLTLLFT